MTHKLRITTGYARLRLLAVVAIALLSFASAAAAAPALGIAVTKKTVTISNVPSGGTIVLFSCMRSSLYRSVAVKPEARVLHDDDRDGVIRFTPTADIPLRSVWVAVDEASGQTATGAPPGFPLLVSSIGADSFRKDVEGEIASLAVDLPRLVLLLVTPGKGAWLLRGFDGEASDRDGQSNGRVQLSFEDATTIDGKDKAPKHIKKDDVVVAIDPGHLDVFVTQAGK
jgi:hypothetical protein